MTTSSPLTRVLGLVSVASLVALTVLALVVSPADVNQQDAVRLLYIHVPAAFVMYVAFGITTLASLRKSRIDAAAADDEPGTPAVETSENAETNDEAEADENSERNEAAQAGGGELDEATVAEIEKIETQPSAKPFRK